MQAEPQKNIYAAELGSRGGINAWSSLTLLSAARLPDTPRGHAGTHAKPWQHENAPRKLLTLSNRH